MLAYQAHRFAKLLLAVIVFAFPNSSLLGQWHLGLGAGAARFWGGSQDNVDGTTSFLPYRPTTFGIGLERQAGHYGFGLQGRYFQAGVALVGPEVTVSSEGIFKVVSVSPEVVARIATLGPDNHLRIHAGPLFEVWDIIDLDARTRLGAQGSVSVDVPLGGRFRGAVTAGAAVIPSPYNEGELDLGGSAPTYELRALWRRSFEVTLHYRL